MCRIERPLNKVRPFWAYQTQHPEWAVFRIGPSRHGVQDKNRLPVTACIPRRGEQAGLHLFILVDDTSDTSLGSQLDALRGFIQAQPPTTWIGRGYMRNNPVNILQNFTTATRKPPRRCDSRSAVQALRTAPICRSMSW